MDNQTNQETPFLLPTTTTTTTIKDDSPRKPPAGGGDRLKRDEWSEGAVSTLLEAYESKWVLRNRAKLKGHDWEDVARYVSSRANCTKSPKTQTQCKNKIESMKKRYRSESATADGSSWPLYPRLDLLLRGSAPPQHPPPPPPAPPPPPPQPLPVVTVSNDVHPPPLMLLEPSPISQQPPPQPPPPISSPPTNTAQNSHGSNGVERVLDKEDGEGARLSDNLSDKHIAMELTDSSTPALYSDKERLRCKKMKMKQQMEFNNNKKNSNKKRSSSSRRGDHHNHQEVEIAESIRWLAQVVVRSEQARMDTMREIEKMRIEAEAKRGELDLKRTEIIANTQIEIAKIFATVNKGVDSSLRIGRS